MIKVLKMATPMLISGLNLTLILCFMATHSPIFMAIFGLSNAVYFIKGE